MIIDLPQVLRPVERERLRASLVAFDPCGARRTRNSTADPADRELVAKAPRVARPRPWKAA